MKIVWIFFKVIQCQILGIGYLSEHIPTYLPVHTHVFRISKQINEIKYFMAEMV